MVFPQIRDSVPPLKASLGVRRRRKQIQLLVDRQLPKSVWHWCNCTQLLEELQKHGCQCDSRGPLSDLPLQIPIFSSIVWSSHPNQRYIPAQQLRLNPSLTQSHYSSDKMLKIQYFDACSNANPRIQEISKCDSNLCRKRPSLQQGWSLCHHHFSPRACFWRTTV